MKYACKVCGYEYDEAAEGKLFKDLPDTWVCPVCGVGKEMFEPVQSASKQANAGRTATEELSESRTAKTASDVVMQTLNNSGLKLVLGMVGHSNLGMGEAVRNLSDRGLLKYVGIRHEGAGAFAASAYAKLTGRPAATLSIAGPGATNLLTGLYDAKLDKVPSIALTGQVPSDKLGLYEFQEIDLASVFKDATCAQFNLLSGSQYARLAAETWNSSILGRAPVQITMPDNEQTAPALGQLPATSKAPLCLLPAPNKSAVDAAAEIILQSKYPLLILGEGARSAAKKALDFAEKFGIAIATTYRAKGLVPDSNPLACGVIGLSGTQVSAKIAQECDCIIAVGAGFARHSKIPTDGKKIVRIDSDKAALTHMKIADVSVLSDAGEAIDALSESLQKRGFAPRNCLHTIALEWARWRAEKKARAAESTFGRISPALVCAVMSEKIPSDAIVCADVGNVAYSLGRYFESKNQRFLCSWYLGSIGVGLPSAIGAACAAAEAGSPVEGKDVFAVVGDGGLGQYLADFTTLVKYSMNAKIVVFNNSSLAKISLEQRNAKFKVWQTELLNPSFADFAQSCSALGIKVESPDELDEAFDKIVACKGPAILEILTDAELV